MGPVDGISVLESDLGSVAKWSFPEHRHIHTQILICIYIHMYYHVCVYMTRCRLYITINTMVLVTSEAVLLAVSKGWVCVLTTRALLSGVKIRTPDSRFVETAT